jgi:Ca-activated chloride channel family protein
MMAARVAVLLAMTVLAVGTSHKPDFWSLPDRRGDRLMQAQKYKEAAETYEDPWRIAVAQYRNGDFKDAAATFARVPGADGAFDEGNALLMHGAYDDAIESYDRALGFRPGWQEAEENRALAAARKKRIDDAGADRDQESAEAYDPDESVVDPQGKDREAEPREMNGDALSDEALRATWLRRVQTTPGDFLRAKFAYQAARAETEADGERAP